MELFPESKQVGNVFSKIGFPFSRRLQRTIARIPITIFFKTLKNMKKSGERWRKMAEIAYSFCLIAKAEDIILDLMMFRVLDEDQILKITEANQH
ncbi:uncharacterized protein LOC128251677 [Drosophila gunungcola]|uniref:uncharacterized protein LOC128251677 n=1 Tax=Drosophila gunungcola TaxID=103775 RepID=UPI0022E15478|nr:uncharacterized protein LOC128251677 [Drosophila gunungcola]